MRLPIIALAGLVVTVIEEARQRKLAGRTKRALLASTFVAIILSSL